MPTEGLGRGPLSRLLGSFASTKILDFLTTFRGYDYSITEIAVNTGLSWRTVYRELPKLQRYEVIKESRVVGRSRMYQIETGSTITIKLRELIAEVAKFDVDILVTEEQFEKLGESGKKVSQPLKKGTRRVVDVVAGDGK